MTSARALSILFLGLLAGCETPVDIGVPRADYPGPPPSAAEIERGVAAWLVSSRSNGAAAKILRLDAPREGLMTLGLAGDPLPAWYVCVGYAAPGPLGGVVAGSDVVFLYGDRVLHGGPADHRFNPHGFDCAG